LPRESKNIEDFTEAGKICVTRAKQEATRRFSKPLSKRELATSQVDTRLVHRVDEFLSEEHAGKAKIYAKELFAKYLGCRREFEASWRATLQGSVGVLKLKKAVAGGGDSSDDSDDGAEEEAEKLLLESKARKLLSSALNPSLKIANNLSYYQSYSMVILTHPTPCALTLQARCSSPSR
jgi:hypothetical protein